MARFIFFQLIFFSFSFTWAKRSEVRTFTSGLEATCKTAIVDTSNMPNNRSPNALEWCHSYTLADLFSFYSKTKISAYGIAARHFKSVLDDGKKIDTQLFATREFLMSVFNSTVNSTSGICLEKNFPVVQEDWDLVSRSLTDFESSNFSDLICSRGYAVAFSDLMLDKVSAFHNLSGRSLLLATIEARCKERVNAPDGVFYNLRYDGFQKSCRKNNAGSICKSSDEHDQDDWFELINEKLEKNEPTIAQIDAQLLKTKPGMINTNFAHLSVIIGRQWNFAKQICEYQIRNNWGTDCSIYPKLYQESCKDGVLWIPQMDLQKSLGGVYAFDPEK